MLDKFAACFVVRSFSAAFLKAAIVVLATSAGAADLGVSAYTWTPDPVVRGGSSTFSVDVTNNDSSALVSNLTLVVELPANVDFSGVTTPANCTFDLAAIPKILTCTRASLAAGAVWNTTFNGKGSIAGVQSTKALVSAAGNTDSNAGNDELLKNTTVINGANLTVLKTGPANATAGDVISFTINVSNVDGPDPATTFRLTDNLPAAVDFTFQSASGSNWSCPAPSGTTLSCDYSGPALASGVAAPAITVSGRVITSAGTITNNASVASTDSTTGDPDLTNNGPSPVTVTIAPGTNLRANKTMVSAATNMTTLASGETVNLTLSATNLGPQNATGVAVTDTVSADFSVNSLPAGCAGGSGPGPVAITCTVGALASGASSSNFLIPLTVTGAAGTSGTNIANVTRSSPTGGSNTPASVNFTIAAPFAHLTLVKTKGPNPVAAGSAITNTITLTNSNSSTSAATGTVRVTDALDANETFVSFSSPGNGWACSGVAVGASGTLICDYAGANLARGSSLPVLTIITQASAGYLGPISNTACTGQSATSPHVPADNSAANNCETRTITGSDRTVDLSVNKSASITAPAHMLTSDGSLVYTLTVANAGPNVAPTVSVSDLIPNWYSGSAGTTTGSAAITAAVAGESCTFGETVTCTLSNVASGTPRTITVTVNRPFRDGAFTNTASVSSPDAIDTNGSNNSGSVNIIVDPIADVAVTTISAAPNPVKVGVALTYTTSIKNNGPSTAAGVILRQRIKPSGDAPRMSYVLGSAAIAGTSGATCSLVTFVGAPYAGDEGIECTGFSLADNESRQLRFSVIPVYPYPDVLDALFTSEATISTTSFESTAANNTSSNTITVTTKALDLTVSNNDPGYDPTPFGDAIVYGVSVQNNGPSQATGFKLTVTPGVPPQGTQATPYTLSFDPTGSVLPAGATCTVVGSDVVCYLAASQSASVLPSSSNKTFSLRFNTGPISNTPSGSITYRTTALVESYETGSAPFTGDTLPGNNSVTETTTVLPKTDLQVIAKTVAPASPFSLNQPFTYSVVVGNMGPSPAAGVRVTDLLPSGLSLNGTVTAAIGSGSLSTNSCTSSGVASSGITVACDLGTLPVASGSGDTNNLVTITIPVRATRGTYLASNGFNSNRLNTASVAPLSVAGVPLSFDPTPGNNSNTVIVQIVKSSIAGSVYSDHNLNNALDAGEKIAPAVVFNLSGQDAWGNAITATVNSSAGDFLFDDLPTAGAGGYTIVETQPTGYYDRFEVLGTWSGALPADTGVKPADTCDGTVNCAGAAAQNTISAIKLPQNTAATGYLFQEYQQAVVSGHVYRDLNNDGNRSGGGETDITGVQVVISGTTYSGADVCVVLGAACTQTTGGSGYSFTVPPSDAGGYTVSEQSLPANFYDGKDQNGSGIANVIAGSDNRTTPESIVVGQVNPNVTLDERNFGELPYASLSGSVFVDSNSNAVKDGGETGGVPGVVVTLSGTDYLGRDVCTLIGSCSFTTDASGNYSIGSLPPGTYVLSETPPPGMTHTGAQAGSAGGTGGAGIGVTTISAITLGAGVAATGYNFGEFGQALTGFVYVDLNRNGAKDTGEPGIAGVSMTLSGTTTGGIDVCSAIAPNPCTVISAAGGGYSFVSLPASNATGYTVTEQAQSSPPLNNYQDGGETVGTVNGATMGSAAVNDRISGIIIAVGQAGTNYNFGEFAGSLSGRVYLDANDDGSFNGSDTGLASVVMTLSGSTASGVNVCTLMTCTISSAADGSFAFAGVPASNAAGYTLTETQPVDYADRTTTAGTAGAATTTGSTATGIRLNPGVEASGYLFGEKTGALSGFVYLDANNNGVKEGGETPIAGVSVTLSGLTASGTNVCATLPSCVATTAADGSYAFSGLRNAGVAGYSVTETQPAAYIDGKHSKGLVNGAAAGCADPVCSLAIANVIGAIPFNAASSFTQFNFGEVTSAGIAGRVYHDINNNGSYDAGEQLAGVSLTVTGTDDQGNAVNVVVVSAADGTYAFTNLRPSNGAGYTLAETQPVGIGDYPAATGTQPGTIAGSVVGTAALNSVSAIVLLPGSNGINYNFREIASSIAGIIYLDNDDDGVVDPGEIGLAGVTLTLTGGPVAMTTTSAADGSYQFVGLPAGTYTVTETQPTGYLDGRETAGTSGGTVDNGSFTDAAAQNRIAAIVLPPASAASGNNFGERGGSVNGVVYVDANNNGVRDTGEAGIAGIRIALYDALATINGPSLAFCSAPARCATTDASGVFVFTGVPPGDYQLVENQNDVNALVDAGNRPRFSDGKETAGVAGGSVNNAFFGSQTAYNTITGLSITPAVLTANAGNVGGYLFGEIPRAGGVGVLTPPIVSGYVYFDAAHTRVRSAEPPTDARTTGWTITLTAGKSDGSSEVICRVSTDDKGFYHFDNLACATSAPQWAVGLPTTGSLASPGVTYTTFAISFGNPATNGFNTTPQSGGNVGVTNAVPGQITNITLNANDEITEQNLPLDPSGVIYDALTRAPVRGALVEILGPGGAPVPGACIVSGQNAITTGSNGYYEFLLANGGACPGSGNYTLRVTPPAGYIPAPSTLIPPCAGVLSVAAIPNPALVSGSSRAPGVDAPLASSVPGACPAGSASLGAGAGSTQYYLTFNIDFARPSANVVNNHIALDPVLIGAIAMTKTTPMTTISKGGLVPYTVTATNTLTGVVGNVNVVDRIPPGFRYRSASATLNGLPFEPAVSGRDLSWLNQTFAAGERKTVRMVLVVGAGVGEGEYVNQAWSVNNLVSSLVSNVASATVQVIPDPTFDCSDIIGKVFDDQNANGYQDQGEPGIANVRVVTARGLLVTTDAEGRFHVPCAAIPQADHGSNFVMKLDARTLPSGYRMTTENPRDVRVTRGKMVKLNFGATVHRVVRLELTPAAFTAQDELAAQWAEKLDALVEQLSSRPSILRIAYAGSGGQAKTRAESVAERIRALWKNHEKEGDKRKYLPPLIIETELEGAR